MQNALVDVPGTGTGGKSRATWVSAVGARHTLPSMAGAWLMCASWCPLEFICEAMEGDVLRSMIALNTPAGAFPPLIRPCISARIPHDVALSPNSRHIVRGCVRRCRARFAFCCGSLLVSFVKWSPKRGPRTNDTEKSREKCSLNPLTDKFFGDPLVALFKVSTLTG